MKRILLIVAVAVIAGAAGWFAAKRTGADATQKPSVGRKVARTYVEAFRL